MPLTTEQRERLNIAAQAVEGLMFAPELRRIVGNEYSNDQCRDALIKYKKLKPQDKSRARRYVDAHLFVDKMEGELTSRQLANKLSIPIDIAYQILKKYNKKIPDRIIGINKSKPKRPKNPDEIVVRVAKIIEPKPPKSSIIQLMDDLREKYQGFNNAWMIRLPMPE